MWRKRHSSHCENKRSRDLHHPKKLCHNFFRSRFASSNSSSKEITLQLLQKSLCEFKLDRGQERGDVAKKAQFALREQKKSCCEKQTVCYAKQIHRSQRIKPLPATNLNTHTCTHINLRKTFALQEKVALQEAAHFSFCKLRRADKGQIAHKKLNIETNTRPSLPSTFFCLLLCSS